MNKLKTLLNLYKSEKNKIINLFMYQLDYLLINIKNNKNKIGISDPITIIFNDIKVIPNYLR